MMTLGWEGLIAAVLIAALCGCVMGGTGSQVADPAKGVSKRLDVTSSAFREGATIPAENSAYGENHSPTLKWTGAPPETKSYAVILDDPDAPGPAPFVHWVIYCIPPAIGTLDSGIPPSERLNNPTATMQGKNSAGEIGYFGPRPPKGGPHHYHFRVYALDTMLPLQPGADRAALVEAMKGHVLAYGELVGTFQAP